jgi:hypothetical protein
MALMAGGVAQAAEHLPSRDESLSSNPSTSRWYQQWEPSGRWEGREKPWAFLPLPASPPLPIYCGSSFNKVEVIIYKLVVWGIMTTRLIALGF